MKTASAKKTRENVSLKDEIQMSEQQDIRLIGLWIISDGPTTFLNGQKHWVHAEFKNNTKDTIVITQVKCSFQTEDGHPRYTKTILQPYTVLPGEIKTIFIPFQINLTMKAHTNRPSIEVEYKAGDLKKATIFDMHNGYVIVRNIPNHHRYFFISHKDPENTEIAQKLDHYLQKIGFNGYVAEKNRQPGLKLWEEKILPAIERCMGLIIIWTAEGAQSDAIRRELDYAHEKNKIIIIIAEKVQSIPDDFQKTTEYVLVDGQIHESDLVKLAENIHQMYQRGIFE